jgi:hypothetical protein
VHWCEPCGRYLSPNTVEPDGSCPSCGRQVDPAPEADHIGRKVPWHFWVVVALVVVYLGWRAVQGIMWLL